LGLNVLLLGKVWAPSGKRPKSFFECAALLALCETVSGRGFSNVFSSRATGFHRQAKLFDLKFLIRKTFPLDGQIRETKSSPELVNLPSDWSLMKLECCYAHTVNLSGFVTNQIKILTFELKLYRSDCNYISNFITNQI